MEIEMTVESIMKKYNFGVSSSGGGYLWYTKQTKHVFNNCKPSSFLHQSSELFHGLETRYQYDFLL